MLILEGLTALSDLVLVEYVLVSLKRPLRLILVDEGYTRPNSGIIAY